MQAYKLKGLNCTQRCTTGIQMLLQGFINKIYWVSTGYAYIYIYSSEKYVYSSEICVIYNSEMFTYNSYTIQKCLHIIQKCVDYIL